MTDPNQLYPGIYGEGGYLPRITEAVALDVQYMGGGPGQTAAFQGDVERLAPWKKIIIACYRQWQKDQEKKGPR